MNAMPVSHSLPHINGVPLVTHDEQLAADELRQRASVELLRQAAIKTGLLDANDPVPLLGAISPAAAQAIEALLDQQLQRPTPDDEACRRYHAANATRYAVGEKVHLRHVLFAVTPGVDVSALRQRAEACLLDVRAKGRDEADRFAQVAAEYSNCPSGQQGGDLGWLTQDDCAPEFAREVFGHAEVGVLPRLVHSRFGLHVVGVCAREAGTVPSYEAVQSAVQRALERQTFATALRQYLQRLAGEAEVEGVDLDAASSPLVQ
jgi:peptidyl-prolyl cis-trans isomerase C